MERVLLKSRARQPRHLAAQGGFSLIEVLVSVAIFGIGVLGLMALQSQSVGVNSDAMHRSVANILIFDMFERMIANRPQVVSGSYNLALSDLSDLSGSASTIPQQDINDWLSSIDSWLPDGEGAISCDSNAICRVEIRWLRRFEQSDVDQQGNVDADDAIQQLVMVSQL